MTPLGQRIKVNQSESGLQSLLKVQVGSSAENKLAKNMGQMLCINSLLGTLL